MIKIIRILKNNILKRILDLKIILFFDNEKLFKINKLINQSN